MPNLNQVNLIGHLTADPNVMTSQKGNLWAKFTLAISEGKDQQKKTTYIDCKAFGYAAQALCYAKKGDAVMVEGKLEKESWEKDGKKHYNTVVIANHALLITKTWGEQARREEYHREEQQDELPF